MVSSVFVLFFDGVLSSSLAALGNRFTQVDMPAREAMLQHVKANDPNSGKQPFKGTLFRILSYQHVL